MGEDWIIPDSPPFTPEELGFEVEVGTVFFNCSLGRKGDNFSCLNSGFISEILSFENEEVQNTRSNLFFFERSFGRDSVFISEERAVIFNIFRSCVFRLMRKASVGFSRIVENDDEIEKLRKNISQMWLFCHNSIKESKCVEDIDDTVADYSSLWDSIGHISQIVDVFTLQKLCNDMNLRTLFHIHLEFNMHFAMLLFHIACKYPAINSHQSRFSQVAYAIISDLIHLSKCLYPKASSGNKAASNKEFFTCTCVKEFWLILMHTVDAAGKKFSLPSFWSVTSTILQGSSINDSQVVENRMQDNSVSFKVWILCNVTPLYWFDVSGNDTFNVKSTVPRNWQIIEEMISQSFSDSNTKDSNLKLIMWGCISLTKHWDPQVGVFCLLWDYFSKEMNNIQHEGQQTISKFMKIVYTPITKFDSCIAYLTELTSLSDSDSAFDIFLYYLVATLRRLKLKNDHQILTQIKGRIYSKFHKRSMDALHSQGLDRFTTLFTLLALATELDEFPKKMCSLTSLLKITSKNNDIKKHVVLNTFICLLICKHQTFSAHGIVQKLNDVFNNLITLLEEAENKDQYLEYWDILCFYLDCVEQSFDFNLLIAEESLLICSAYSKLLKITNEKQKRRIYMHFKAIMSSSFMHKHTNDVHDMAWKHIYLPLADMDNRSSDVAEIYAGMTLLFLRVNSGQDSNFKQLITKHGFNDEPYTPFKCLYLSHIISSSSVIDLIDIHQSNYLIKFWIASVVQHLYKSPSVLEFTRSLLNTDHMMAFQSMECSLPEHVETILIQFISHLGKTYASLQTLNETGEFRKKINLYFTDFVKVSETVMLTGDCEKSIMLSFRIGGQLVLNCARAIYSKTSPVCLLPQLLNLFVLPLSSSKKPSSNVVSKALESHIHLFLSGLATLDSKKDDFVARKVKEVMNKYFLQFCVKSGRVEWMRNPFLISLNASFFENVTKPASYYRHLVLDYIRDYFLYFPQPPEHLLGVLSFLSEVVQKTKSEEELKRTLELLSMKIVSCILVCDAMKDKGEPPGIRKLAMSILKKIVTPIHTSDSSRHIFQRLLHAFLFENIGYYQGTLFKTMCSVNLVAPAVMKKLLPDIEILLSDHEKKRGIGVDQGLRDSFRYLCDFVNGASIGKS